MNIQSDSLSRRPTEDELRRTFENERHARPHWPQSFELATRDPLTRRVLMILSLHVKIQTPRWARQDLPQRGLELEAVDDFTHTTPDPLILAPILTPTPYHGPRRQSRLDFKSRAAGEKDD